jgi:hypothetical protein
VGGTEIAVHETRARKRVEAGRSKWELGGTKKSGRERRGAKGSSIHA